MADFSFRCTECGAEHAEEPGLLVCPRCSARQEKGGPTRGVLEVVLDAIPEAWPSADPSSAAFLRAFLPLSPDAPIPPLSVGGTPLLPVPRLREALGLPHLWLKDDTRNPSGSTKDRASLLVVAKAIEYGYSTVASCVHGQRRHGPGRSVGIGGNQGGGLRTRLGPPSQTGADAELRRGGTPGGGHVRRSLRALSLRV